MLFETLFIQNIPFLFSDTVLLCFVFYPSVFNVGTKTRNHLRSYDNSSLHCVLVSFGELIKFEFLVFDTASKHTIYKTSQSDKLFSIKN